MAARALRVAASALRRQRASARPASRSPHAMNVAREPRGSKPCCALGRTSAARRPRRARGPLAHGRREVAVRAPPRRSDRVAGRGARGVQVDRAAEPPGPRRRPAGVGGDPAGVRHAGRRAEARGVRPDARRARPPTPRRRSRSRSARAPSTCATRRRRLGGVSGRPKRAVPPHVAAARARSEGTMAPCSVGALKRAATTANERGAQRRTSSRRSRWRARWRRRRLAPTPPAVGSRRRGPASRRAARRLREAERAARRRGGWATAAARNWGGAAAVWRQRDNA